MPEGPSRFLSPDLPLDPCLLVWDSSDHGGTESWKSVTPGNSRVQGALPPCPYKFTDTFQTARPDLCFGKLVPEVQSIHNILLGDRARSWGASCPRAYFDSKRGGDLLKARGGIAGSETRQPVSRLELSPPMLQSCL